jgi:hypothetical protein
MPNTIRLKRNTTPLAAPAAENLVDGELAMNVADGVVFLKNSAGTVLNTPFGSSTVTRNFDGSISVNGSLNVTDKATTRANLEVTSSADTQAALDLKAPLASPALTGTPTAPTAAVDTNTTQVATTAFAKKEADDAQAAAVQRANHTGTQPVSTITGLASIATTGSASDLITGILPAAAFDATSHGPRGGGALHQVATTSVAGFLSSSDKTKLDGVATGATANSTDAQLRDRATHTGTQLASTISDFSAAVEADAALAAKADLIDGKLDPAQVPTDLATSAEVTDAIDDIAFPSTLTLIADASNNVKGYGLTTIPNNWQNGASTLKGLSIGSEVTSIGSNAFYYCTGFTGSLTIPNSVTSIGVSAFYFCTGFTGSLTIPNSVTSIGVNAFGECFNFTGSLTIPNSVTSIGVSAFYFCTGFTGSLTIPNSVTSIGGYAFSGCTGFTGPLTIPNSVTTIGSFAFYFCTGFTGPLTIPNSVTSIGSGAFQSCIGFGSLIIPNSVTSIGNGAFGGCSGITNVQCYVTKTIIDAATNCFASTGITTINARASDGTWTAGAGQTIGGKSGITVIKDLV